MKGKLILRVAAECSQIRTNEWHKVLYRTLIILGHLELRSSARLAYTVCLLWKLMMSPQITMPKKFRTNFKFPEY
ncbi:hypothetical protein T4B_8458 [Trichinella pseudospiralis]|uniref:Uncharacterized protein n=1 Tax=Trichinella pseudospiralis TaxID=6337 RepID=A0A0V1I0K7_TRIPS|nr:hypothetical protein T4B_8458 [Trichinella pseudospiralis]